MNLNTRPSGCVKVYADLLRKTTRLLTPGLRCTNNHLYCENQGYPV